MAEAKLINRLEDLPICPQWTEPDSSTNYTGVEYTEYLIEIDGTGSPNTFRWSRDGGLTFPMKRSPSLSPLRKLNMASMLSLPTSQAING